MTEEKEIKDVEGEEKTAPKGESKEESTSAEASADKKVKVPEKFKKLVEEIEKMSVLDLAELVKILEKKFGVSAAAPVAVAAAPAAGAGEAAAEEKSVFNIELVNPGEKKIEAIKIVRDLTQKGLKEAKDLVDATASGPQMVKENVEKKEAEAIKKQFEAAGAKVELR